MISFFRKIRNSLLDSGRTGTYILYAFGEITLVVIGILIALQINNWNELQKDRATERTYLMRIQDDLEIDLNSLENILSMLDIRLKQYSLVDSLYPLPSELQELAVSIDFDFNSLIQTGRQFRPTIGAYRALISDGQTNLIRNRDLFANIQHIYEIRYDLSKEYAVRADEKSDQLLWSLRSLSRENFRFDELSSLSDSVLEDLNYLYTHQNVYRRMLTLSISLVSQVIDLIQEELENEE